VVKPDSPHHRVRGTHISYNAQVVSGVRVDVGNRITRQMTRLPSCEICGDEPDPILLGLGFAVSSVGDGESALWYGVAGQSLFVR
jgi:hypothetical protein